MAYQLDRPDLGAGLIVALRRPDSPYETAHFGLRGLEPNATYRITNLDSGEQQRHPGAELLQSGVPISIGRKPGSALVTYTRE